MSNEKVHILYKEDRNNFIKEFNRYLDENSSGYLLVISPDDTFRAEKQGEAEVKWFSETLSELLDKNPDAAFVTPKRLFQCPDRITGIMFNLAQLSDVDIRLNESITYSYEADFLLRLMQEKDYLSCQKIEYFQSEPGDGNYREFPGVYDRKWYLEDIEHFLIPILEEFDPRDEEKRGRAYYVLQYFAMYSISCRLMANQNNFNRHVLNDSDIDLYKDKISAALKYVDDDIIMSAYEHPVYKKDFQFNRMLLRIKYGDETLDAVDYYDTDKLRCNIQFMNVKENVLEIDGSVPDIFYKEKTQYYFEINGKKYKPEFCERYSLTKYFSRSAYKRFPFHVNIQLDEPGDIRFFIEHGSEKIQVLFEFKSHTSRLANYPRNSYWHGGRFLFTTKFRKISISDRKEDKIVDAIKVSHYNPLLVAGKEIALETELLTSFRMHRFRFWLLRAAWVLTKPFFSRKEIWLFFDKIYKGGDSSEYLYRYTIQQMKEASSAKKKRVPDKAYYLLDKSAPDYERLTKEGYKPLVRGSFLHRLVFLNANVLVASNSTVFAFNDYYLENSRYIRGIPDFHVVCVQHGLSVQKIGLAQQRLRDNTRLYFCASKYEIENLSHPIYDYEGYDALRLTGVPRYDGLINDDKKQILISPTWRMQSAMLVSKNEGVERDYNPEFKHTPYFKVYNSLINDKKLIEGAKKYGYKIAYVLHPIVSPQYKDFDSNDSVKIIPSTGDMSYEKMFRESSLMVTDYSGVQFDFAYMRKPLVYYHPTELEAHYEEGTFHYDTMAFGEIVRQKDELVNLLLEYMKNGCEMKELYRMRADDFFAFSDRSNCERVYKEIVKYRKQSS